jgi:hypothetical protein
MRKPFLCWLALALLGLAPCARAQPTARGVIEKAVQAHGGVEQLAKLKALRIKSKGTAALLPGADLVAFTGETTAQLPGQIRNVMEFEIQGKKHTLVQVIDGDKVALTLDGQAQPLREALIAELKELTYAERVNALLPLLHDASHELALVGEGKVNGQPALAVQIRSRGHKDIVLHFDRASGLLVKAERRTLDTATLKEVPQEEYYGAYKEVEGLRRAMQVTVFKDGKKFLEGEVTEVRFLDRLDPSVFAQP